MATLKQKITFNLDPDVANYVRRKSKMTKLKMSAIAEIMIRAEMRSEGEYYSEEALKEYEDSENG